MYTEHYILHLLWSLTSNSMTTLVQLNYSVLSQIVVLWFSYHRHSSYQTIKFWYIFYYFMSYWPFGLFQLTNVIKYQNLLSQMSNRFLFFLQLTRQTSCREKFSHPKTSRHLCLLSLETQTTNLRFTFYCHHFGIIGEVELQL